MTVKIANDMAEVEFKRFADAMYLDIDENEMSEDEKSDFSSHKKTIIKALCNGSLIINEGGNPVYSPVRGDSNESITFHEIDGATLIDMDKGKPNENMRKMFSMMQSLTKKPVGYFGKMKKNPDLKVCIAISTLFLAG